VNTVKRRTHSLYRQGLYWYDCIPTMREDSEILTPGRSRRRFRRDFGVALARIVRKV
jgi:hypothetical protein